MAKYLAFTACMFLLLPSVGAQLNDRYTFQGDSISGAPTDRVVARMRLDIQNGPAGDARPVSSYEYATRHDPGVATVVSIEEGSLNATVWNPSIEDNGYSINAIFNTPNLIPVGTGHVTEVVTYELVGALGRSTTVEFTTDPVLVLSGSAGVNGVGRSGLIRIEEPGATEFVRGDCNDSGMFDIGDGIFLLGLLFNGGGSPHCDSACDTNGDDQVDIADAVSGFGYLFGGQAAPEAPFPGCGVDPGQGPGDLGCVLSASCL